MRLPYRHVQYGWVAFPVILAIVVLFALQGSVGGLPIWAWIPLGIALVIALVFSRLRVDVDDRRLAWRFGSGWPGWQVELANVVSVEPDRSKFYEGWGLRFTPRGMLYNVSGLDAVEVTLRSGKRFRLGTDDPQGLARAIRERLADAHAAAGAGGVPRDDLP